MNTVTHVELMQNLSRGPQSNIFSFKDHAIVREAIAQLQDDEQSVIVLRFWEKNTITEIASILDLTWNEVEQHMSQALSKLQKFCLETKGFSRSTLPEENVCGNQKSFSKQLSSPERVA